MGTTPDVLVIGGGIIGLTSAYLLAKEGLSVEVIDKGELGKEASWAGAGIIPPGNPDRAARPIDKLRAIGSARFPEFSAELRERTGIDNGYLRCGGIEFLSEDDGPIVDVWFAEGIPFNSLEGSTLAQVEPAIRPPSDTFPFLLPGCAQVRNPWHLRGLIEACRTAGVTLRTGAEAIVSEYDGDRVRSVFLRNGEKVVAGHVLIAAGAWSRSLFIDLDLDPLPAVRPVRGQIVLFNPGRQVFQPVVMFGKRYLVPRADGRVLVGSTEEPEAGFEKATTPEGVQGLTDFAQELVPALRDAAVEATWAGLRPGSPDGMPFIGPVPGYSNVYAAVGHFRAGIQLSIGSAELIRDLLTGQATAVPADAFRLDREPHTTARPAFRS